MILFSDMLQRHIARHAHHVGNVARPSRRSRQACDACRANKTKCGGGVQCSLCEKRGIACTYDQPVAGGAGSTAGEETRDSRPVHPSAPVVDLLSPSSPRASVPPVTITSTPEPPPATVEMAHQLRAEKSAIAGATAAAATAGMRLVLAGVSAKPGSFASLLAASLADVRAWYADCCAAYVDEFHIHWPVLPLVTLDIERDAAETCVAMAMIGCWIRGHEEAKVLVVAAHEQLMDEHFVEMTKRTTLAEPEKPWEIEKYQAILLNLVFAFYSNRKELASRASLLLGLFITKMRQIGIFDPSRHDYQEKVCFPATFPPFLMANRQQWRRLAAYLFKLDSYLSLLTTEYPTLRPSELTIGLPSTGAIYDAPHMLKMMSRLPQEPVGRDEHDRRLCDVLKTPNWLPPDAFLVEDCTLGFCSSVAQLWKYCYLARRNRSLPSDAPTSKAELLGTLTIWKQHLDAVVRRCELGASPITLLENATTDATTFPLRAYCGRASDSAALALERAQALACEATILYHVLSLHLHADLKVLGLIVEDLRTAGPGQAPSVKLSEQRIWAREWARSADGLTAMDLAVSILDEALWIPDDKKRVMLPLADAALDAASVVMRAWIERYSMDGYCSCQPMTPAGALSGGITLDKMRVSKDKLKNPELGSMSICRCNVNKWEGQFRLARQYLTGSHQCGASCEHEFCIRCYVFARK
ncbi:hypothetical protein B0H66DRAFT_607363 [Apodospora peruviana]|uniref:Zn(2)-C6 fungal-type domain-containing protein n=1 Tax=Apodospora peruviana TaxID=516989 RepID=A0AAE0HWZ0_9PEZI|nr:hypothetical protein B0H66DRAFT_607363 [Apodospora peruviana]